MHSVILDHYTQSPFEYSFHQRKNIRSHQIPRSTTTPSTTPLDTRPTETVLQRTMSLPGQSFLTWSPTQILMSSPLVNWTPYLATIATNPTAKYSLDLQLSSTKSDSEFGDTFPPLPDISRDNVTSISKPKHIERTSSAPPPTLPSINPPPNSTAMPPSDPPKNPSPPASIPPNPPIPSQTNERSSTTPATTSAPINPQSTPPSRPSSRPSSRPISLSTPPTTSTNPTHPRRLSTTTTTSSTTRSSRHSSTLPNTRPHSTSSRTNSFLLSRHSAPALDLAAVVHKTLSQPTTAPHLALHPTHPSSHKNDNDDDEDDNVYNEEDEQPSPRNHTDHPMDWTLPSTREARCKAIERKKRGLGGLVRRVGRRLRLGKGEGEGDGGSVRRVWVGGGGEGGMEKGKGKGEKGEKRRVKTMG